MQLFRKYLTENVDISEKYSYVILHVKKMLGGNWNTVALLPWVSPNEHREVIIT